MPPSTMNAAFHARRKAQPLSLSDPYYIQYSYSHRLCVLTILSQLRKLNFLLFFIQNTSFGHS